MVARTVIAPARVNILGEHTDRFGGLALPFATSPFLRLVVTPDSSGLSGDATVCAGKLQGASPRILGWRVEYLLVQECHRLPLYVLL